MEITEQMLKAFLQRAKEECKRPVFELISTQEYERRLKEAEKEEGEE